MKVYFNLPKSGEGEAFYTRYASLTPTTNLLGYLAQIISALTEWGILFALLYNYVADLAPTWAAPIAATGATLGTAFIELGLRKFMPFTVRAILYKRKQGLDWWMSVFSIGTCIVLLACSGLLSFKGSKITVAAATPPPAELTTEAADSTHRTAAATIESAQADELAQLRQDYSDRIKAAKAAAAANVNRYTITANNYNIKEERTGKVYATAKARAIEAAAAAQATGEATVADIRTELPKAIAAARVRYREQAARATDEHRVAVGKVDGRNLSATDEHAATVSKYGGGLAYFTLVCLATFIVCISLQEIHRKGSGMEEQVEPSAFAFEPGLFAAWAGALTEKMLTRGYNRINTIESKTAAALEPVAAPTLWSRKRPGIVRSLSVHGKARAGGLTAVATAQNSGTDYGREALDLLHESIVMEGQNNHAVAQSLALKAEQVLTQYLGPEATPATVMALRNDCVNHLNGEAPNPFAHHHHRQQIGFNKTAYNSPPAATASTEDTTRITTVVNDPMPEATERVVYVDKSTNPCAYCGERFLPRQHNHKYCKDECRINAHAAKHGGKTFKPNYKAWRDEQ
jgi:hypothetical protein